MNEYLNWIDEFLEEADAPQSDIGEDSIEYFDETAESESTDDLFEEQGNGHVAFSNPKKDIKRKVSVVVEKIKALVDSIIQKIKELSLQLQVKFSQLKFKQALKKVGRNAIKEIKTNPYLTKQGKALAAELVKANVELQNNLTKPWTQLVTGKIDVDTYDTYINRQVDKFNSTIDIIENKMNVMDSSDSAIERTELVMANLDNALADISTVYSRTVNNTLKKLNEVKADGVKAARASEARIAEISKVPASEQILVAVSKVSSAISKVIGRFTTAMHKILAKIASAGDKAIRAVAGKTAEKQSKKKKLPFKESAEDYEDGTETDTEYDESWEDEIDAIIASL
jgi:hypothetical protein